MLFQALLLIGASSLTLVVGAGAQSPDRQVEWQQVLAAAKKEKKVVVSVPPGAELRKMLKEVFERRFGIELELVTGRKDPASPPEDGGQVMTERNRKKTKAV